MATAIHILLVEDLPDDAALLLRELRRAGYDVVSERVATEASLSEALAGQRWDLCLADFSMPGFSGIRALQLVHERDPDLPFIFVSGTIGEDTAVMAMRAGAHDYVMKGNLKRLLPAIERELREAEERRERRRSESELQLIQDVALAVAASADLRSCLETALRMVSDAVGCELAQAWLPSADGQSLTCSPAWYAANPEVIRLRTQAASRLEAHGSRPVEQAWSSKQPVWVDDSAAEPGPLQSLLRELGLRTCMAVPVLTSDQTVALLEFYLRAPYAESTRLLRLATAVGTQVASIIQRRRAEEQLAYLAHYDPLTDLPNRVLLADRLRQALADAFRRGRLVAVALLDLDRFKTINDSLGHEVGDMLLKAAAERLASCVRKADTVARLSGDEFALVLADLTQPEDAARVARKIVDTLAQPFQVAGRELYCGASLGLALYPFDDATADGLLRCADVAMYRAKDKGGGTYQFYRAEMTAKAAEQLVLETGLRRALERNEFHLVYQPKASLTSGAFTGCEALLRWRPDPAHEVLPDEFVGTAEEIGLIAPIGLWVLRAACQQAREWLDQGLLQARIAVNLSTRQFWQPGLAEAVGEILAQTGLPADHLELEVTESVLMLDTPEAGNAIEQLGALGVRLVLDDFGTGYSSLAYLKRLRVDSLKIDQSFVRDVPGDADDAAIIAAIIAMAHRLGMTVVAEGVETEQQLAFLREHGCDEVQGWLLAGPLPPTEAARMLAGAPAALPGG